MRRYALAYGVAMWAVAAIATGVSQVPARPAGLGLYDPDPNHPWNRVHRHLLVRVSGGLEYGFDRVDPLLWRETQHLLVGASHRDALAELDRFLATRGDRLIADPVKRAVFQHDLWAVFDWLADPFGIHPDARHALMSRLARVIRRVALTREEIDRLPDTYNVAVSFPGLPTLPRDFFGGSWFGIESRAPLAPQHAFELSRSGFHVLWRLPEGADDTASYLRRIWDFPQPFVPDGSFDLTRDRELRVKLNPALPAVPDGTQIALLRSMLLIDESGQVVPTKIVQSLQVRVFHHVQTFAEFMMRRASLFAGQAGGLHAVGPDDQDFLTFSSKGMDPFDRNPATGRYRGNKTLDMCEACHSDLQPRLESIRSLPQLLKPHPFIRNTPSAEARWLSQGSVAAEAKIRRSDWGALQALWRAAPR